MCMNDKTESNKKVKFEHKSTYNNFLQGNLANKNTKSKSAADKT